MPNHYTTMAICVIGYDEDSGDFMDITPDEFDEKMKDANLCNIIKPRPDGQGIGWANMNWGTKWGTYGTKAADVSFGDAAPFVFTFQSAWWPPDMLDEITAYLKSEFKFDSVTYVGYDPCDCSVKMLQQGTTDA